MNYILCVMRKKDYKIKRVSGEVDVNQKDRIVTSNSERGYAHMEQKLLPLHRGAYFPKIGGRTSATVIQTTLDNHSYRIKY